MKQTKFDLVVVGAGPGGYVAAIRAAQLGMRTALVEKAELGGICLNWGCIPTKALLKTADTLRLVRKSKTYGVEIGQININFNVAVDRSRAVASQLQKGVTHLMKKNGVTVIKGHAQIQGHDGLLIDDGVLQSAVVAKHIILATGSRARSLPMFENGAEGVWYYRDALMPKSLPKRLLIIGAGAIGLEFASFYHEMGSQVDVVEMSERVLPSEDEEISAFVKSSLMKEGLGIHVSSKVVSAKRVGGTWQVQLEGTSNQRLEADVVLVAAGVVGNVENLGLEKTKVEVNNSFIMADGFGVTAEPNIYAIGDVVGAPCLAHKASHQAIICVEKIAGLEPQPLTRNQIPACTYSYPQVAHVGLTEAQARSLGHKVKVGKFPFLANGKAIALGATEGFVKVVFDANSGELLGAHMVGEEATEMIQGYTIASQLETTEEELMHTVFPHPTLSESMHEAVLAAYDRAIHI